MNAIELLKQQHQEVSSLFEQYEGEEDTEARRQLFIEIADDLSAHSTIEEKIFYPGVKVKGTAKILEQSLEDHLEVKRLIAGLLDLRPTEADFDRQMKVLKDNVERHVEEEENELFPIVQKNFSAKELSDMGQRMEHMFEELAEEEPHKDVPAQTDAPARID